MKVFVSHTDADKPLAESLGTELLRFGVDVWLDKWEMFPGDSLYDRIESGMNEVDAFIIMLSAASLSSSWVRDELKIALNRRRRDPNFRIVPVLLEQVRPPAFIEDLVYINWHRDSAPVESVLRALKRVTLKPASVLEASGSGIEFRHVTYRVRFAGDRGRHATFHERLEGVAASSLRQIDRTITFAGSLVAVSSPDLEIDRRQVNPHLERWTLRPRLPIGGGSFSFNLSYAIEDGFAENTEVWSYGIEAPTDRVWVELDFEAASAVKNLDVFHVVGRTRNQEPIPISRMGNRFVWEKLFPAYKDTYEFVIEWADSAT